MVEKVTVKEPLLFLCHRIPFPPNKGDKIRSFNILKLLNQYFDVYLGCFVDDEFDRRYVERLSDYCAEHFCLEQSKTLAKMKGLTSFLQNKPITLPYYFDSKMQRWADVTQSKHNIDKVFIYSSSMAQYCEGEQYQQCYKVIDFVDVDSDKWRQYAEKKSGLSRYIFSREYRLLAKYEDKVCQRFEQSVFVSPDEAKIFSERQPAAHRQKVHGILNGVDVDFFDPKATYPSDDIVPDMPFVSFTGAMDYWANVDAVLWFTNKVWPQVLAKIPTAQFVIAGGNPSDQIKALRKEKGIVVTGRVNDIRPFIADAACVVAPMQIARGIQNKVLEAMSLNRPVICSPMAMEGINAAEGEHIHITNDVQSIVDHVCGYLNGNLNNTSANREWIISNFTWRQTLSPLMTLIARNKED